MFQYVQLATEKESHFLYICLVLNLIEFEFTHVGPEIRQYVSILIKDDFFK